jgi:prepilin signal peptidase PulO-like enzyme (type II secretory pathway)
MLNLLFGLIGLLVGGLINVLADDWPRRERPSSPHCPHCAYVYKPAGWLAVLRLNRPCPKCGVGRKRPLLVEVVTAVLFAALPSLLPDPVTLLIYAFYIALLLLIIVIDLENRLILDITTLPGTALALLFSLFLPGINFLSAALGAVIGFLFFLLIYWVAKATFGPGAIGQGDVKLALLMGAMLGVPQILLALVIGILLGGLISGFLLATRLVKRRSYLPYGQYLALAAIIMLLWGETILRWWLG